LNIGIEKLDTHKGVTVKALLDSGTTGMFMDKRTAARHGFMPQKLERPIMVRNVDRTNNSRGAITHQVEYVLQGSCRKDEDRRMRLRKNRSNTGDAMITGT